MCQSRWQDVLREEADAAVADAHGRRGEAVDVFAVQEVALQLLFRECGRGICGRTARAGGLPGHRILASVRLCH